MKLKIAKGVWNTSFFVFGFGWGLMLMAFIIDLFSGRVATYNSTAWGLVILFGFVPAILTWPIIKNLTRKSPTP